MVGTHGPAIAVAAAMAVTGGYCLLRPAGAALTGRRTDRAGDLFDGLMSVAMALMALAVPVGPALVWALAFVAAGVAFAGRATYAYVLSGAGAPGLSEHGADAVLAAAMVPMLLAPAAVSAPMSGMVHGAAGPSAWRVVAVLALALAALPAVRALCAVSPAGSVLAPRSAALCRVVMTVAMAYLLVAM